MTNSIKRATIIAVFIVAALILLLPTSAIEANGPPSCDLTINITPQAFPGWWDLHYGITAENLPISQNLKAVLFIVRPGGWTITYTQSFSTADGTYNDTYDFGISETGTYTNTLTFTNEAGDIIYCQDFLTFVLPPPEPEPEVWVRTMPMTCWQVWINENNNFEFIFWYPYKDNNWVRIYDMEGNMVYEVDVPLEDPHIIVDLPDGMYAVKVFWLDPEKPTQEFIIGKP